MLLMIVRESALVALMGAAVGLPVSLDAPAAHVRSFSSL